jgi:uncharacterized protein DUF6920
MSRVKRTTALVAGALAAGAGATAIAGARAWTRMTERLVARLWGIAESTDRGDAFAPFDVRQLDGLPAPVARYFTFALPLGQRAIRRAHLRFRGTFAAKPGAWAPFTADQHVTARPPGFVWDARIAMMPIVPVRVRDSYVGGEGSMRAAVASVVSMTNQHGTKEMAVAALQRFLAEAVWLPTALLPRDGLTWSAIDDDNARVTLTDGATTASLDAHFAPSGELDSISTKRYRDVKGTPVLTPWIGTHTDYRRIDGMMIPTKGEVAWVLPEGPVPYWRGGIVEARFDW